MSQTKASQGRRPLRDISLGNKSKINVSNKTAAKNATAKNTATKNTAIKSTATKNNAAKKSVGKSLGRAGKTMGNSVGRSLRNSSQLIRKATQPKWIGKKIKKFAQDTSGNIKTNWVSTSLRKRLSDFGIGVDDVKSKARLLDSVLKDLRDREFLKDPSIQYLIKKVQERSIESANLEAQKHAKRIPRKHLLSKPDKSSQPSRKPQNQKFLALSEKLAGQVGGAVVRAILDRVDEVRKTLARSNSKKK